MTPPPGIDLHALNRYLNGIDLPAPERIQLIAGGMSNLTYLLSCDDADYVLRRPPLGHVLATAHDMAREYRVITALGPTAVPVPGTIALCEDVSVLGAPFYLMAKVDGYSFRTRADLATREKTWVADLAAAMMATLAGLHAVDPAAVGLADFGRPTGYLERQVRTWTRQLESSRSRDVSAIERLRDAVAARVPQERGAAIVHGDFRLDNLLVDQTGTVQAIVDWEMATLGDPLADVALTLAYVELADRQRAAGLGEGIADASTAPGFPDAGGLVDAYATAAGLTVTAANLSWHLGLSFFKLAVILEGIHLRYSRGQTVGDGFDTAGELVALAVDAGLDSMKVST